MHRLEESHHEIDVFEALLERSNPSIRWGVEMGGGGPNTPLVIAKVIKIVHRIRDISLTTGGGV